MREIGLLKSLRHDNIIELQDVLLRESRIYLVFELWPCNLRDHMEQLSNAGTVSIDPPRLQSYMSQLLSALAFCHERRIIHRDLKPDNILMDKSRRTLKVAGFNMARTVLPHTAYTQGFVTAWYHPPEIILGDSRYGPPVDMWSAGCILAEMLTLAPVFRCSTQVECLLVMFRCLGTPDEASWPGVSALPNFNPAFPRWPPQPLAALLNEEGDAAVAAAAGPHYLALLGRLLQLRPENRITAREALGHPFF
jgi:cyclin-dependent kinase 2